MCLCFFYDTSRHSVSIIKVHPLCIIHNFSSPFFFFYYIMQTAEYEFISHIQLLFTLQRYEFFCKSQRIIYKQKQDAANILLSPEYFRRRRTALTAQIKAGNK